MRINLLPLEERKARPKGVRLEFLAVLIGIVLLVSVTGLAWMEGHNVATLDRELQDAVVYRMGLQRQREQVDLLQNEVNSLQQKQERYQKVFSIADSGFQVDTLTHIHLSSSPRLWLERLEFNDGQTQVAGYTFQLPAITEFLFELEEGKIDTSVRRLVQDPNSGLTTFVVNDPGR